MYCYLQSEAHPKPCGMSHQEGSSIEESPGSLMEKLQAQLVRYQAWLKSRPQGGADLEVIFKWTSYYLAGMYCNRSFCQ